MSKDVQGDSSISPDSKYNAVRKQYKRRAIQNTRGIPLPLWFQRYTPFFCGNNTFYKNIEAEIFKDYLKNKPEFEILKDIFLWYRKFVNALYSYMSLTEPYTYKILSFSKLYK